MKTFTRSLAALALALLPTLAHAHLRNYLDTYGYSTLEKGRMEVETFNDYQKPEEGKPFWHNETEVEMGITDHYTLGVYGVFNDGLGFTAAKLENRYRFSEKGQWPVDTAVYLELKDANDHKDDDELEAKIILSKDFGPWNVASNLILEHEREIEEGTGEAEWESHPGLTLATCYATGHRITPGVEVFLRKDESRITPGLYMDVFPNVRFNLGYAIGLDRKADDYQVKSILELEF